MEDWLVAMSAPALIGAPCATSRRLGTTLCSTSQVSRRVGEDRCGSVKLSRRCGRRAALMTLGLPLLQLAHEVGLHGAQAAPSLEVSDDSLFGFDGLGQVREEYIPGKIVALAQAGEGAVLFLGVDGYELPLQLLVGPAEAMAVLTAVQERRARRPVTHEAWGLSLAAVGWKVDRFAITSKESDVFYSRVIVSNSSTEMKSIDVRPSDGIALALRCHAPLFVRRKIAQDLLRSSEDTRVDPLKRPSLQAGYKSGSRDNHIAPRYLGFQGSQLLFIDDELSGLLGAAGKVIISS